MKSKLFSLAVIVVFTSLTITTMAKDFKEVKNPPVDENFETFYSKFYSDAAFQQSRIYWPLDGGKFQFGAEGLQKWTQETLFNVAISGFSLKSPVAIKENVNSKLSSDQIATIGAVRTLEMKDGIYIEQFYQNGTDWSMEYHYKLINNKWFLIYYKS
jgi:hypothetical protein